VKANVHHLPAKEPDPELLLMGATAGAAVWAGTWMACRMPLPGCAFRAITGIPCPTCGATHCVLALMHGHVAQAIGWNPLAFAAIIALACFNLYSAAVQFRWLPRIRFSATPSDRRVLFIVAVLIVAANWAYEIHRL
jgi:hypothetical protein